MTNKSITGEFLRDMMEITFNGADDYKKQIVDNKIEYIEVKQDKKHFRITFINNDMLLTRYEQGRNNVSVLFEEGKNNFDSLYKMYEEIMEIIEEVERENKI